MKNFLANCGASRSATAMVHVNRSNILVSSNTIEAAYASKALYISDRSSSIRRSMGRTPVLERWCGTDWYIQFFQIVPRSNLADHQRLSKIATLRAAIQYIQTMLHILECSGGFIRPILSFSPTTPKKGRKRRLQASQSDVIQRSWQKKKIWKKTPVFAKKLWHIKEFWTLSGRNCLHLLRAACLYETRKVSLKPLYFCRLAWRFVFMRATKNPQNSGGREWSVWHQWTSMVHLWHQRREIAHSTQIIRTYWAAPPNFCFLSWVILKLSQFDQKPSKEAKFDIVFDCTSRKISIEACGVQIGLGQFTPFFCCPFHLWLAFN